MNDVPKVTSGAPAAFSENTNANGLVTPELVRQVADRVYALILEDLQIEQERRQLGLIGGSGVQGGGGYGHSD